MKKFLFFLAILAIVIFVFFIVIFFQKENTISNTFELTEEFEIDKVIYYSSANAISNTTNYQNPEWNLQIYQYTDIAIYLKRLNFQNKFKYRNYITNLILENIEIEKENSQIYYLDPNEFGNSNLRLENLVENTIEYTVINSENKNKEQSYNIPIFFQDCSNPITFRIVTELAKNYQISDDQTLIYNGSLIEKLGLGIKDLNKNISFDLKIKSTEYGNCKHIDLLIPYEENGKSILDGDIKIEKRQE